MWTLLVPAAVLALGLGGLPLTGGALAKLAVKTPLGDGLVGWLGTLSAIAVGASRSLVERSADVALKERRRLILVPRETPYSAIHLENMLSLTRAGAVILPASPGFYHRPATIDDLVNFVVARVLDHLGVEHSLMPRWGSEADE